MPSVLGQQNVRNDVDNIEEFLKKTIPVLSLVSKTHEPSSKFDVDTKVEHVCKYLRALDNNVINRKFNAKQMPKNILAVLDVSGSMIQT